MTTGRLNYAHSVDAPIALPFQIEHSWRRATDAPRSAMAMKIPLLAHTFLLALLGWLCAGCHCTTPQHKENESTYWSQETYCHARGKNYKLSLTSDTLRTARRWTFTDGRNPDLLPGRVALLARRELRKTFSDATSWGIASVALKAFPRPSITDETLRDRWYYEVTFTPPNTRSRFGTESYTIYVLDGDTIVTPQDTGIDDI